MYMNIDITESSDIWKKWNNAINCRGKFKLSSKQKIQTQPGKISNIVKELLKSMSFSNFVDNGNNEYCKKIFFKLTAEWDWKGIAYQHTNNSLLKNKNAIN